MDDDAGRRAIGWLTAQRDGRRRCELAPAPRDAATSPTAPTSMPARPGPRCARTSNATCRAIKRQVSPERALRRRAAALRRSPRDALREPAGAGRASGTSSRARSLRLHDQRLSLRAVPRHAGQGGGLPARLARRRSGSLTPTRLADILAALLPEGARGQHQHRARALQAARRGARPTWQRMARHMVRARGRARRDRARAPGATRGARARARALLLPRDDRGDGRLLRATTLLAPGRGQRAARAAGLDARRGRGGAPAPPRRLLRRLPRRGRVRGPGGHASPRCASAGIGVAKMQLSAGLRVCRGRRRTPATLLRPFDEGVYLHQVVERRDGGSTRTSICRRRSAALARRRSGAGEWRVHFTSACSSTSCGPFAIHPATSSKAVLAHQPRAPSRRTSRSRPTPGTCCAEASARRASPTPIARELALGDRRDSGREQRRARASRPTGS